MCHKGPNRAQQNFARNLVFGLFVAGIEPLKGVRLRVGILSIERGNRFVRTNSRDEKQIRTLTRERVH